MQKHGNRPVRILQVTGGMNRGGAETMLMHLYRKIDRSKIQFDFISFTDRKCAYDDEIRALGGRIFCVKPPRDSNMFRFVRDIYRIIKQKGPFHAVHAHTLFNSGLALFAARLAGIKLRVCHSHNTLDTNNDLIYRKIYFAVMRWFIRLNANRKVACTSAAGRYMFGGVPEKTFTVLYNAIDLTPYKNIDLKAISDMKRKLGIGKDTLVLGHVGRFGKQKNHEFLIRLAEALQSRGVDFKLVMIGQGDLKTEIESAVKEKGLEKYVKFLGVQTNIPLYMRMFDVFVFPSLYEGLGIVLIEAQAAGTPCVISDTIPKECDMGLGLIRMLNLSDSLDRWMNAINESSQLKRVPAGISINAIMQRGYNLDTTAKTLAGIYDLSI